MAIKERIVTQRRGDAEKKKTDAWCGKCFMENVFSKVGGTLCQERLAKASITQRLVENAPALRHVEEGTNRDIFCSMSDFSTRSK